MYSDAQNIGFRFGIPETGGKLMTGQVRPAASKGLVAKASVTIDAPKVEVWRALTTPKTIKEYMFGADVETDWRPGNPITWKGEWQGKQFTDKGEILAFEPERRLQYSHYSPISNQPDRPENYHTVTYDLSESDGRTTIHLAQDNNPDQETLEHSTQNWQMMLDGLKKAVES
jgi:uncharacterized protein YndB with AHSA1/START domain